MSVAPNSPAKSCAKPAFVVRFGTDAVDMAQGEFPVSIPVLDGVDTESIFTGIVELPKSEGFRLFQRDGLLVGAIDEVSENDLTAQAHSIYRRILKLAEGRKLSRIWNYVPCINKPDATGLENYRAFCRGRSLAFEERLGQDYAEHLPAASAVGGAAGRLAVVFAAMRGEPEHFENPEQLPAYEYPLEHGPRSPSFARATRVRNGETDYVFISGTAAIKGHATIAPGDLGGQIACTLDNLRIISRSSGLGENLGATTDFETGDTASVASGGWDRHFKIYLRHASDMDAARTALEGVLYKPADRVTWLLSDICREALLIEIEATLVKRA